MSITLSSELIALYTIVCHEWETPAAFDTSVKVRPTEHIMRCDRADVDSQEDA